jgi:hypothetical protein
MRLPADRREWTEWILRLIALAAMAWLIVAASATRRPRGSVTYTDAPDRIALAAWSIAPVADTLGVWLRTVPSSSPRDWLVALRRSGTSIVWGDSGVVGTMVDVEPLHDPARGQLARIAAPEGAAVVLEDQLGLLDTLRMRQPAASMELAAISSRLKVTLAGTTARTPVTSGEPRHVVVLGRAGWEAKFLARAMEERGWDVDFRLTIAPGMSSVQGRPLPLDLARHSVVVVLDSSAQITSTALRHYLAAGGGVVLLGSASALKAPLSLVAGGGGVRVRAATTALREDDPRAALAFTDLSPLMADAVALDVRRGQVAVAARRVGAGRLIQVGYEDTWRWRMLGGEAGESAHRAWWSTIIASAAFQGAADPAPGGDPAPLAAWAQALGSPVNIQASPSPRSPFPFVLALLIASLLTEWTSRRLRGAA